MVNKLILIIEDDVELCAEIAELLRDEGHSVNNTSDSIEGDSLIKKHLYDIVILDLKMPGLSGIDLLKRIKFKNKSTSVLVITGRPFVDKLLKEEKVFDLVDGYLNKPFNCNVLIDKINNAGFARSKKK